MSKLDKEIDNNEALMIAKELFEDEKITKITEMKNYHVFSCEKIKKKLLFN